MVSTPRTTSGWAVTAAVGVVFLLAYLLRTILLPFLLAAALAYIAQPVLHLLHTRLRFPHVVAVILVFLAYLALLGGLLYGIGSQALVQMETLLNGIPKIVQGFFQQVVGVDQLEIMGQKVNADQLTRQLMGQVSQSIGPAQAVQAAKVGIGLVMGFFLTIVLLFYFLLHGHRLTEGAIWLLPPSQRTTIRALLVRVNPMLGRYIRGVFIIVAITSILSWIGIDLVLRIPNALLLALATGVLEMVPVVGPLAAAIIVGVVAIQQGSIWLVVGFVVYYIILRLLIDQVIGPLVLGKAATLHPVVIILAFLAGGILYGMFGVLLAVPVAATIRIVLTAYYEDQEALNKQTEAMAE